MNRTDILLVTPPLLQPNTAYPATAYLNGYLKRRGAKAGQMDLSVALLTEVFTHDFLSKVFDAYDAASEHSDENTDRIYRLRKSYLGTVDAIMKFLRGEDPSIANLICSADFLPQAGRFAEIEDLETAYGSVGLVDCAKYLSTLYLEDLTDFIRAAVAPHFELVRYAEKLSSSLPLFDPLKKELETAPNLIEDRMLELLRKRIDESNPSYVGFSIPFPGNLLPALRCAQFIRENYPLVKVILGGGYPSTELRSLSDPRIFEYVDYIVLDDGELPLERILQGGELVRTLTLSEGKVAYSGCDEERISHKERGCPDFSGLPLDQYISLVETVNPMQRMWSDGQWNKMLLAHGCYWAKCAFCDTSLDYICRYEALDAVTVVDYMERIMAQTGKSGFHFVDEAAPPKLLKEMALEILRRGLKVSWWGNIRFEPAFTGDVCQLLTASGCVAVSGGVEVASDRLLTKMNKGISIEQLTLVLRNFYYSGIMAHTYLMYGFPTQTLQETVDSLEVVRQLFRAELIGSAFWHRYAMTVHSPTGLKPEEFGVRVKNKPLNRFANNEIHFAEDRQYNVVSAGESLRTATYNYMRQSGLEKPVHKWFEGRVAASAHEDTLITDHLIKPDASRIYDEHARLIWIGVELERTEEGVVLHGNSKEKSVKFKDFEADFLMELTTAASDLSRKLTFGESGDIFAKYSEEPFLYFYHSKKWDILRGYGLLQV